MCATEHAPCTPFCLLERCHGLAKIVERGSGVPAQRIGNGLQFFITPKAAWKAYGADGKGVSDEAVVWTRLIGWSIVLRGIYMGSLILGAARKDAMGFTFVAAALNGLRFALFDAETIGTSKATRIYFVAFPLLVAAASFATLEPSELLSP